MLKFQDVKQLLSTSSIEDLYLNELELVDESLCNFTPQQADESANLAQMLIKNIGMTNITSANGYVITIDNAPHKALAQILAINAVMALYKEGSQQSLQLLALPYLVENEAKINPNLFPQLAGQHLAILKKTKEGNGYFDIAIASMAEHLDPARNPDAFNLYTSVARLSSKIIAGLRSKGHAVEIGDFLKNYVANSAPSYKKYCFYKEYLNGYLKNASFNPNKVDSVNMNGVEINYANPQNMLDNTFFIPQTLWTLYNAKLKALPNKQGVNKTYINADIIDQMLRSELFVNTFFEDKGTADNVNAYLRTFLEDLKIVALNTNVTVNRKNKETGETETETLNQKYDIDTILEILATRSSFIRHEEAPSIDLSDLGIASMPTAEQPVASTAQPVASAPTEQPTAEQQSEQPTAEQPQHLGTQQS